MAARREGVSLVCAQVAKRPFPVAKPWGTVANLASTVASPGKFVTLERWFATVLWICVANKPFDVANLRRSVAKPGGLQDFERRSVAKPRSGVANHPGSVANFPGKVMKPPGNVTKPTGIATGKELPAVWKPGKPGLERSPRAGEPGNAAKIRCSPSGRPGFVANHPGCVANCRDPGSRSGGLPGGGGRPGSGLRGLTGLPPGEPVKPPHLVDGFLQPAKALCGSQSQS